MATLVGSSHIKGSTETVRMILLTFAQIGISYVTFYFLLTGEERALCR